MNYLKSFANFWKNTCDGNSEVAPCNYTEKGVCYRRLRGVLKNFRDS